MNKRYIATVVGLLLILGANITAYGQIVKGKVFGGGQLAAVNGTTTPDAEGNIPEACTVTISSGSVYGKVYGAGEGLKVDEAGYHNDVAKVHGDVKVELVSGSDGGGTAWQDVFGGGALAKVNGNTYVNMSGGHIAANLFGGGEGDIKKNNDGTYYYNDSKLVITSADISGNTNVDISGGDVVWDRTSLTNSQSSTVTIFTYTKHIAEEGEEPARDVSEEVLSTNTTRIAELVAAGYVKDEGKTKEETTTLVEGEIVYWDTDVRTKDYTNETDSTHKIHNELFYDEENKKFKIEHNIFGGGYIACNVGDTAFVTMTRGLGDTRLTATNQWKDSFEDYAHPHFYCFGGGYGAYTTVKNTKVVVNVTEYDKSLDATVDDSDEQLARPRGSANRGDGTGADPLKDDPIYMGVYNNQYGIANATVLGVLGGSYAGFVKENTDVTVGGETFISRVYGGGFGQLDAFNYLQGLNAGKLIADDAFFGTKTRDELGEVGGNTLVNIVGGNIYGNVYGGGAGVESAWFDGTTYTYKVLDKAHAKATKDFTMGEVLGIAKVEVSENAKVFGNVFGGGDVANVQGTGADKDRTTTNGEAGANEDDYTTAVRIFGGHVYGEVYGGGSGRKASLVANHNTTDNSIAVGKVEGNAYVHIYNSIPNPEYDEEKNPDAPKYIKAVTRDEEGIQWPYVYGDIYGGCAFGVVTGSTDVVIDGGMIGDNIFGGGLGHISDDYKKITSANVLGNTVVTINGGNVLWNESSNANGDVMKWPVANYTARGKEISDANALFYDYKTKRFLKDHNVYGGGNVACIVGTTGDSKYTDSDYPKWSYPQVLKEGDYKTGNTVVMMNESHLSDPDLFMNYAEWTEEPDWSLAAKCWQATLEEQREPQFSVFGAGKGLLTKTLRNSQARVEVLAVKYNIEGQLIMNDGRPEEHWTLGWDYDYEHKLEWTDDDNAGGTEKAKLANFYPEKDWKRPNYVDAERRLRTAAFAKQIGVAGNTVMQIVGGGYDGSVEGNTLASGESRAIIGKMYGGGYGSYEGWKLAKTLGGGYDKKVGTVKGQAVLNIDRGCLVRSDVFAGGAGVESLKLDADNNIIDPTDSAYKDAAYTDFLDVARVDSTYLKFGLVGASSGYDFVVPVVYGYVYGGGDVANVTGIARSELLRGQAMQYFFGGGNGRLKSQCRDYTQLGSVGATDVHFKAIKNKINRETGEEETDAEGNPIPYSKTYGSVTQTYFHEPIVWHRAFAGGRNGLVSGGYIEKGSDAVKPGNTRMIIDGGQFGYNIFGGGEGTLDTDADGNYLYDADGNQIITSADIFGNTYLEVNGGDQNVNQIWDPVNYKWTESNYDEAGTPYSPQYDWELTKFNINHNIYAGGRMACVVEGDTYFTMTKGMLNHQYFENFGTPFLESWEWRDIYKKHASPHFCIFGGGFGEHALVLGDTHVDVQLDKDVATAVKPSDKDSMAYTKFPKAQTLMDVIGGGYSGDVIGTCHVTIDGNTYIRNVFGGAYQANAGASVVNIKQGNIDNVYGGGMMGNVKRDVAINIAQAGNDKATANHEVIILGNVYGGNDVAGYVGATEDSDGEVQSTPGAKGIEIKLQGGHIYGNVYGGGNGDYLYKIDQDVTQVTADEHYPIDESTTKLVYRVPVRKNAFPSFGAMSDAQKIVNISSYRPLAMKTSIDFGGNGVDATIGDEQWTDLLRVDGNIFGGGSSTTLASFTDEIEDCKVKLNVGSHIRVGGVFLGSDGDALFNTAGTNNFIQDFPQLNGITLARQLDWVKDPANVSIPFKFLSVSNDQRPSVYKNVLDLYFMPVEMNVMPEVTWNGKNSSIEVAADPTKYVDVENTETGVTDAEIGTFCCGGNRGNMNTTTNFHVNFPEGLTITGNIIGGCNNSNDTKTDANGNVMSHTGGFLLGTHKVETGSVKRTPQIHLTMRNQFRPTMEDENGEVTTDASKLYMYREGNNVYGGCYHSGTVRGDILIDMRSNMINGLDSVALDRGGDSRAVCNVYGAGFGSGTWVYGDTQVLLGNAVDCSFGAATAGKYNVTGASANYVYGGGQRGNVVGTTTVRILNGRVAGCVVGASYASNLFGSAQTIVGYPDTYYICNTTGRYELTRVDRNHSDLIGDDGKPVVKRQIWHTKGDIVSEATYSELAEEAKLNFDEFNLTNTNKAEQPTDWSEVNIQIDQAIYGGGYALPDGSGSYTVRKYTSEYNLNNYAESIYGMSAGTTLDNDGKGGAYGGNTFVMIGDRIAPNNEDDRDHITISSSQLVPLTPGENDELFGKYYRSDDGIVYINYPTTIAQNSKFETSTPFYSFIGRGGLYGDGRLSLSEGYRVSDIRGYGYNGTKPSDAKLLNCLHRFDASRFTDCCVSILGDLDYTTTESGGSGAVKYAIARIGELQMVSSIDDTDALSVDVTNGGTVTQMDKRSRNYIGFSNIVSNLGAVWSNVPFDGTNSKHHDEKGVVTASTTYKKYKQNLIAANYDSQKAELKTDVEGASAKFQKRNNGTAKNMLGIASGFALRVENDFAGKVSDSGDPVPVDAANDFYYGPVEGVFEIKLVNTRPGEAAGYVYAQNKHQEDITVDESHTVHDFMESTGNFVFPMSDTRKVVDDCYPYAYTKSQRDNVDALEYQDGHYWFVTGFNYYYYGTITGYTFDSQNAPLNFNMNSKELRINLTGAKKGQQVTMKEFRLLKTHSPEFAESCDIENKFYTNKNEEKAYGEEGWTSLNPDSYYMLSLSATEGGVYKESEVTGDDVKKIVPHISELAEYVAPAVANTSEEVGKLLEGKLQSDNPYLAIRLKDAVNNNGKVDDGKTSYLKKYLDEACQAIIVLTTPAVDDNGARIYDSYEESNHTLDEMKTNVAGETPTIYYVLDGNGDYHSLTADEVTVLTEKPAVVFVVAPDRYTQLGEGEFNPNATYYIIDNEKGTLAPDGIRYSKVEEPVESEKANYYTKQAGGSPKTFEYTINLTIKYIQGPDYEGKATVQNCALPGEMIRLSSSTVTIISDAIDMPPNGSLWTIGPGKKLFAADGTYTWTLDESQPDEKFFKYNPKDDEKAEDVIASRGVLSKACYDEDSKDLYIPAYYFMDGYVARFSYSVRGIYEDEAKTQPTMFHVTVFPEDTLLVHNYHRMNPTLGTERTPVETYIRKAAKRYADDQVRLAADMAHDADDSKSDDPRQTSKALTYVHRPRVYIEDRDDLKKFAEFVNASSDVVDNPGNDYGKDLEFFLMANIEVPSNWTPIANFKGTFHGNGHVLTRLDQSKSLFAANEGEIYNLGLETGNITQTETPSRYHCCYTKGNNTVYRMDGSIVTSYTEDDWKYGKVAYDLNQYYLEERHDRNTSDGKQDTHDHDGYVENIYANGDYQYARTYTEGEEYLRTSVNPQYVLGDIGDIVTNPENITFHDRNHGIDEARAYYNDDAEAAVFYTYDEYKALDGNSEVTTEAFNALPDNEKTKTPAKAATFNEYRPLFEEAKHNSAKDLTTAKNDYLFFGQYINNKATSQALPSPLVHTQRQVASMYNRVYRAYGFRHSKVDDTYHFNAEASVLDAELTAIDFTGAHDAAGTYGGGKDWQWQKGFVSKQAGVFYPMIMDLPARVKSFVVADANVTKNLLVYTDQVASDDISGTAVSKELTYTEATSERAIKGHQVMHVGAIDGNGNTYATDLLHLVERKPTDDSYSNDFNAPIPFTVNNRAWYQRLPLYYRTVAGADDYGNPSAWEGICLPFTSRKVSAKQNGEITHFYGAVSKDVTTLTNDRTLHHEYWLRGMVRVDDDKATFARPSAAKPDGSTEVNETLFVPTPASVVESETEYLFSNSFLYTLDGGANDYDQFDDASRQWYKDEHTYRDYSYLTRGIPYVVSFPGKDFYEFDLSGQWYSEFNKSAHNHRKDYDESPQLITFESLGNAKANPIVFAANVAVSDDELVAKKTQAGGYEHIGTYMQKDKAPLAMKTGSDADGKGFLSNVHTVSPFRTYLDNAPSQSPAPATRAIWIVGDDASIPAIEENEDEPFEPGDELDTDYFSVYGNSGTLYIESSRSMRLEVYNAAGQCVRRIQVESGKNTYTGFDSGMYIVARRKLVM